MSALKHRYSAQRTYLDGTFFQYQSTSYHNLLIRSSDMKVPSSSLVDHVIRDMATVQCHRHHDQFLDSFNVWARMNIRSIVDEVLGLLGRERVDERRWLQVVGMEVER